MFSRIPNYDKYYAKLLEITNQYNFNTTAEREAFFLHEIRTEIKKINNDKTRILQSLIINRYLVDIILGF